MRRLMHRLWTRYLSLQITLAAVILSLSSGYDTTTAATQDIVNCDGYPCVNFAFGANVSRDGEIFGSTFYNPPRLGAGLEPLGGGRLCFMAGEEVIGFSDCAEIKTKRMWPFARVEASDPRFSSVQVVVTAFCPNGIDDRFVGTLPVAMAQVQLTNQSSSIQEFALRFEPEDFLKSDAKPLKSEGVDGVIAGNDFVAWVKSDGSRETIENDLTVRVRLDPGAAEECRLMIGHWDEGYPSSTRLTSPELLAMHVARYWESLLASTERLGRRMPKSGDDEVDEYLRWYTTAGVAMTRAMKDGTTLTMGYHELNQRDSYWTTWAHLVLWPSLEKRMIEESVWGQRTDGKVPTTILPLIEREEDVDINCFFILRALRYVHFHKNEEFGLKVLPSLKAAAMWLARRDTEGNGLPRQTSYWNDWKDVPGMEGRAYSPYASMLYVAAMKRLGKFCQEVGDPAATEFLQLAAKGEATLNRPTNEGGMFNGRYYEHLWVKPPDVLEHVSEDQTVGVLFDVVPDIAKEAMLTTLRKSMTEWGARETYPFFGSGFGYDGGDYHNGGIWPYLNHVHAWALLRVGRKDEALDLLRKVGRADLVRAGDYIPHEYLDGRTGNQAGVPMQGWNAAMFGAIYFGLNNEDVDVP